MTRDDLRPEAETAHCQAMVDIVGDQDELYGFTFFQGDGVGDKGEFSRVDDDGPGGLRGQCARRDLAQKQRQRQNDRCPYAGWGDCF